MDRKKFIDQISEQLYSQLVELKIDLQELKSEMENDTKSSAGDKFETSREMSAQEFRRLQTQIEYKTELIHQLNQLPNSKAVSVQYGSLVELNNQWILLGVGAGKFEIENTVVMCLSIHSPLGIVLVGKQKNDSIHFNNNTFTIQSIS